LVKRGGTSLLLALTLLLVMPAYWLLFSTLMAHDDEGYVLISLQNYVSHGELYTKVFSQYGPFFYFFHDIAHRLLDYEFTNTSARFLTLGCWLTSCLACAHLVWKQTRNSIFAAATLFATFVYLQLMVSEPGHPGGLIAAMVALAVWIGAGLIERRAIGALAIVTGLVGGALLLTKINVGLFFVLSGVAWFALHLKQTGHARFVTAVIAAILFILPFALMKSELHEPWARGFAILSVSASLAMVMTGWSMRHPFSEWKFTIYGLISAVVVMAIVTASVAYRGTSFQSMFVTVVLSPLRQPGVYHFAPDWKPAAILSAVSSVMLAAFYWLYPQSWFRDLILGVRLVAAFVLGLAACHWFPFSLHSSVMSYIIPWSWTLIIPLAANESRPVASVRLWLGLVLALQYLHAYPVAGSQIAWGTFLAIPLVTLGLHDAWIYLAARTPALPARVTMAFAAILPVISVVQIGNRGWHQYQESPPLALRGAENIRPPREFSSALRMLAANAKIHGDMLFSLPGMFSFNQWTGLPTPTFNNTTHWFTLLDERQQGEIADALTRDVRPVVIVHQGMLKFLSDAHFSIRSPLTDFLNQNFVRSFRVGDFEFWVRRGRKIVPVNTAEFLHLPTPRAGFPTDKLELVVDIPPREKIASIELVTLSDSATVLARWDQTNAQFGRSGISVTGDAAAAGAGDSLRTISSLTRLNVALREGGASDPKHSMVLVKNASGDTIAEARFVE